MHIDNGESFWSRLIGVATTVIPIAVALWPVGGAVAGAIQAGKTMAAVIGAGMSAGMANVGKAVFTGLGLGFGSSVISKSFIPDDFYLPIFNISPQEIFANRIPLLDVNFISPNRYIAYDENGNVITATNSKGEEYTSIAQELQPTISRWYSALRNMVMVGLMIVLLYIGIRIVMSSTSKEAAKYKENLQNWIVAVLIVVFMHYIMAFALTITEEITSLLNSANAEIVVPISTDIITLDEIEDAGGSDQVQDPDTSDGESDGLWLTQEVQDAQANDAASDDYIGWRTNFLGQARIYQQIQVDDSGNGVVNEYRVGYTIIYFLLVVYTIMFLVIYIKRVIYMAFLTLIAPLVALTYPIDKIADGKAQAFDMWIKEYIFNLLIQPFHLLLYTILVGSAMDLATSNMLYAVVAIGFLLQAEKLLRRFFGFEKAQTTGTIMGGAIGGAMVMQGLNSLGRLARGGTGPKGGQSKDSAIDEDGKIKMNNPYRKNANDLYKEGMGTDNSSGGVAPNVASVDAGGAAPNVIGEGVGDVVSNVAGAVTGGNLPAGGSDIAQQAGNNTTLGNVESDTDNSGLRLNNNVGNDRILDQDSFFYHRDRDYDAEASMAKYNLDQLTKQEFVKSDDLHRLQDDYDYKRRLANVINTQRENERKPIIDAQRKAERKAKLNKIGGIAKVTGRYAGKIGLKALRAGGKLYGGLTYGAIGAMAGMASDDFSNVFKYGATGAGLGYAAGARGLLVGSGLSSAAAAGAGLVGTAASTAGGYAMGSVIDNPESVQRYSDAASSNIQKVKDDYAEEYYGGKKTEGYKNYKKRQFDNEFMMNKKIQDLYKQKFGDNWKEHMEVGLEYAKNGVKDHEKAISTMQYLEKRNKSINSPEAKALAKAADSTGNESDLEYLQKRWRENKIPESKIHEFSNGVREINNF